jgi:hypothetical protein
LDQTGYGGKVRRMKRSRVGLKASLLVDEPFVFSPILSFSLPSDSPRRWHPSAQLVIAFLPPVNCSLPVGYLDAPCEQSQPRRRIVVRVGLQRLERCLSVD